MGLKSKEESEHPWNGSGAHQTPKFPRFCIGFFEIQITTYRAFQGESD